MNNSKVDPDVAIHLEWLGFVQPTGLVVSALALAKHVGGLNSRGVEGQNLLRECMERSRGANYTKDDPSLITDFREFATSVLGWNFRSEGYAGTEQAPIPSELELYIPDTNERISPAFAVRLNPLKKRQGPKLPPGASNSKGEGDQAEWQLLVTTHTPDEKFDADSKRGDKSRLSPHRAMERLLRHTGVSAGLLFNGSTIRLISAPRGESSGWIDFRVTDMLTTDGRLILAAMCTLLGQTRLLALGTQRNLAFLLQESRKYQNTVSEHLAEQVLHALYELVRGFQIAHDTSKGVLLQHLLDEDPDEIYGGLLTLVMRLIFLLYSEERDMLPQDDVYENSYSLAGLHQRLQADAALYPDTMDQRFGAYSQIVSLSRIIYKGAKFGKIQLPERKGNLFDPDRYRFLEGRDTNHSVDSSNIMRVVAPLVPDGTIYRVLKKLTVLHAERISYRALDVEHIGSVYETMMGFKLETASGPSISIKSARKHGAPTTINLEALLREESSRRAKWLLDKTDRKLTDKQRKFVQDASSLNDIFAALGSIIDKDATPDLVPQGAMVLQPSEERRRTGSHYTPRYLSESIVKKTLDPVLDRLTEMQGGPPTPDQILGLKICDPAMGSGAFLVSACRILGKNLIEAWKAHDLTPELPPDEDEEVLASRLVAQRCLYGVDLNSRAVELAKMSLWLVTLARDHPVTFLDHALRHGDSLVGLAPEQILAFHWKKTDSTFQAGLETEEISSRLEKVRDFRQRILDVDDRFGNPELPDLWHQTESELDHVRIYGDLALAAYFKGESPRKRENLRAEYARDISESDIQKHQVWLAEWKNQASPFAPFHWAIEFPEVFSRDNPGFDAIVGNPPFLGGTRISTVLGTAFRDWLATLNEGAASTVDLVAHFFRRSFDLLRTGGAFGLIATNSIFQGATRAAGLKSICDNGGEIYFANRRVSWTGHATVVTSVVHIYKGKFSGEKCLDGNEAERISAFLFHAGGDEDPARLRANSGHSFSGMKIYGLGFTFDDTNKKDQASPLAKMRNLFQKDPRNKEVVFPYIGGEVLNSDPTHAHRRHVIDFRDFPLRKENLEGYWKTASAKQRSKWLSTGVVPIDYPGPVAEDWPDLLAIVEEKVRPERERLGNSPIELSRKQKWWQFAGVASTLRNKIRGMHRVMAASQTSKHLAFTFLPTGMVYSSNLVVISFESHSAFCLLQSHVHEVWARFFGSTLEDRLVYTPTECFETFPFPAKWASSADFEAVGKRCFDHRASIMMENCEGLTQTYNKFCDPTESSLEIEKLRQLHTEMDRMVLDAYGWQDIPAEREHVLDFETKDTGVRRERIKPYRLRWPDSVRDEVLARLLELNRQRAIEEDQAES